MNGYAHGSYALALGEFGKPTQLPDSGGWFLKRSIPNTAYFDGIGCYPLFACEDWSALSLDFQKMESSLVSLAVVTDPFGDYTLDLLTESFSDICRPFKEHFVVDLSEHPESFVSSHHLRNVRKGLRNVEVDFCDNPVQFHRDWIRLYDILIERHQITGMTSFSHESFLKQLKTPGIYACRAEREGQVVGMILWYVQDQVAYYHLGAYNDVGYKKFASFALFWKSIEHFRHLGLRWLSLGAGAGVTADSTDGLSRFKAGWSTGTRTAFFCGRIFQPDLYKTITLEKELSNTQYFPAYRAGEFG